MRIGWVLPTVWALLAVVIVVSSLYAHRSRLAFRTGIVAVSVLWTAAGAAVNGYFVWRGDDYSGFADGASTAFVRETWESLVVPHHGLFIGVLVAFEAMAGVLVLVPGPMRQAALLLLIWFNLALVAFGWGFLVWAVPIVVALTLLRRADRVWRERRRLLRLAHLEQLV